MEERIIKYRRDLHQIPELDRTLPETLSYVRQVLEPLGCTLFSPAEGALCAWFDAGKKGTVAFRADMDALPVAEHSGAPYCSRHPGVMHACGHDGHMAMLLELAHTAARRREELLRNVLLIFQPAEETDGGAKDICDSGVLQQYHVERIFGLHLWPGLPSGTIRLTLQGRNTARAASPSQPSPRVTCSRSFPLLPAVPRFRGAPAAVRAW